MLDDLATHQAAQTIHSPQHHPVVTPMRDQSQVVCNEEIEVVVEPFSSFGRIAHLRRSLLHRPGVTRATPTSFAGGRAAFLVQLSGGTVAGSLVIPGTQLTAADQTRVHLTPLSLA